MKKPFKVLFLMLTILSLCFSTGGIAFAISSVSDSIAEPMGMTRVSIYAERTTSTNAKITGSGSLTSMADYITTTATLYEYNKSTGSLTKANVASIIKTSLDCTSYSFNCNFPVSSSKSYKVKLEIEDYTNGKTNTTIAYSTVF